MRLPGRNRGNVAPNNDEPMECVSARAVGIPLGSRGGVWWSHPPTLPVEEPVPKTIAIVEDDADQLQNYADALRTRGYAVQTYGSRAEAEAGFAERLPDLAILDIVLHDEVDGGFELSRTLLRLAPHLPVIFLTDRSSEVDKVAGLLLAWDYVPKPITLDFLAAKVAALFRIIETKTKQASSDPILRRGPLVIDEARVTVEWQGARLRLTVTEFEILLRLVKHPGHVVTYDALMDATRQMIVTKNTITTHIRRIRDKFTAIEPTFARIENEYGLGYRWSAD